MTVEPRHVKCLVLVWLAVVWVGLWGDVTVANVVGGHGASRRW